MANGLMGFPQFAPGGKGGLIPSIQMPQTRMSFPTPRGGGGSRAKVPAAAYLAPYLVSEGLGALLDRQQPTVEEQKEEGYYERYPEGKTRDAAILADQLYGVDPKQEKGFKGFLKRSAPVLADVLAGAAFGEEGGAQYGATATNIRQAKKLAETNRATRKQAFIADKLAGEAVDHFNVMETGAARVGVKDRRIARTYANDPTLWIPATQAEIEAGLADEEGYRKPKPNENWIRIAMPGEGGTDPGSAYFDANLKSLNEKDDARGLIDSSVVKVITVASPVLDQAAEEAATGKVSSQSLASGVVKLANDVRVNIDGAARVLGFDDGDSAWAMDKQGGSDGRIGSGAASRSLFSKIHELPGQQQIDALNHWVETADLTKKEKNLFKKRFLQDVSLRNVRQKAALLQLAYLAAAANGQTGRTLSDKDLAFHLEMVGYGSTQDPAVLHDNLIRFIDVMIDATDNETQVQINPNSFRKYPFDSPELGNMYKSTLGQWWTPEDGENWTTDPLKYTFRNFYNRYGNIQRVDQYSQRKYLIDPEEARVGFDIYFPGRYKTGTGTGTDTDTDTGGIFEGLDVPLNLEDV